MLEARPCSTQNICARVPSANPRPGIAGEDCNHPPDGVADTTLPHRSTTSRWQVSPRPARSEADKLAPGTSIPGTSIPGTSTPGVDPPAAAPLAMVGSP